MLVSKKWMLKGVSGECNSDELPSHPSPSFPPEAVVEAQLAALRLVIRTLRVLRNDLLYLQGFTAGVKLVHSSSCGLWPVKHRL